MVEHGRFSRLRGVIRNAVVWGVARGTLAFAISVVVRLMDGIPVLLAIADSTIERVLLAVRSGRR